MGLYQHLFRDEGEVWRPDLDGVAFDTILEAEVLMPERPFSEEEVLGALKSMPGDKVLGPDSFSMAFFQ